MLGWVQLLVSGGIMAITNLESLIMTYEAGNPVERLTDADVGKKVLVTFTFDTNVTVSFLNFTGPFGTFMSLAIALI